MKELVEFDFKTLTSNRTSMFSSKILRDRLYELMKDDLDKYNVSEWDFHSRFAFSTSKSLKSLGLYLTKGRGDNKTTKINPIVLLTIRLTFSNAQDHAKALIEAVNGSIKDCDITISKEEAESFLKLQCDPLFEIDPCIKTYLMKDGSGYTKIGKSINPRIRERTLQSSEPTTVLLAVSKKNVEKELHDKFDEKRIRGEWFDLTDSDISKVLEHFEFELKI